MDKLKKTVLKYDSISLDFCQVGNEFNYGQELKKITKAMYYRLLIPSLFPQLNKAIYLDSDVIVNTCISNLYNVELKDNYIAGVLSPGSRDNRIVTDKLGNDVKFSEYLVGLGMQPEIVSDYYINSGVILFNCEKFRNDNLLLLALEISNSGKDLFAPDQDILNVITQDKKLILDLTWNFQTSLLFSYKNTELSDWFSNNVKYRKDISYFSNRNNLPNIIHYVYNKPWEPLENKCIFNYLYWDYKSRTPWKFGFFSYLYKALCVFDKYLLRIFKMIVKKIIFI